MLSSVGIGTDCLLASFFFFLGAWLFSFSVQKIEEKRDRKKKVKAKMHVWFFVGDER